MDFYLLLKKMGKNAGKNISKNLSGDCSQKLLDHSQQSAEIALKTSWKRIIQKTAEATCDLTGNEIANKITKVSKSLLQNDSKTVTNEHDKEIPKKRYISPEKKQKIIDDLRLI